MALTTRRIVVTAMTALLLAAGLPAVAQTDDSASIELTGIVEEYVSISVDNEADFTIVDGDGNLTNTHENLFEVAYSANTDFDITVDYDGTLEFGGGGDLGDSSIDYELSVGETKLDDGKSVGDAVSLSNPDDLITGDKTFEVDLKLTDADKDNLEAGNYTDTADFTITAE